MNIIIKFVKIIKNFFTKKSKPKLDYHKEYWFPNGPDGTKAFNRKIKIDKIYKLNSDITYTHWNIMGSKHKRLYSIPVGSCNVTPGSNNIAMGYNNITIGKWNVSFYSPIKGEIIKKRIEKINKIWR
jgi:hypothetical protein